MARLGHGTNNDPQEAFGPLFRLPASSAEYLSPHTPDQPRLTPLTHIISIRIAHIAHSLQDLRIILQMASATLLFLLLSTPALTNALDTRGPPPHPFFRRTNVPPQGYYSPLNNGGSMLTVRTSIPSITRANVLRWIQTVPGTFPAGLGEPLNVIISGNSDSDVLKDQETDGGLRNYFLWVP